MKGAAMIDVVVWFWLQLGDTRILAAVFKDIGPHGTKIIVFNFWSNDDGNLELDFDANPEVELIKVFCCLFAISIYYDKWCAKSRRIQCCCEKG